jgi:hypothetical protein
MGLWIIKIHLQNEYPAHKEVVWSNISELKQKQSWLNIFILPNIDLILNVKTI